MTIKIRFDAADYPWEGPEEGYRGHDDRLCVEWDEFERECFPLTPEGIAEMLETI